MLPGRCAGCQVRPGSLPLPFTFCIQSPNSALQCDQGFCCSCLEGLPGELQHAILVAEGIHESVELDTGQTVEASFDEDLDVAGSGDAAAMCGVLMTCLRLERFHAFSFEGL